MDVLDLSRLQFTVTTIYHFFFVPLSLGLTILVAITHTAYARTGKAEYEKMTKFWGKLLVINFAMGVVTGIVMEFQFGMNWSEYARFMGDIFGAPLAIEALMAFFLESTFLGVWIFGWNKLPRGLHALSIWLGALGTNISALWILIANSFMQQPVGYKLVQYTLPNGDVASRVEMKDFLAIVTNPNIFVQYPHVLSGGMVTAAFFVMGISAYHLLRKGENIDIFKRSFQMASIYGAVGIFIVLVGGHDQAQHMVEAQPMKMAAAEALWDNEDPASMSLFTIGDEKNREDVFAVRLPSLLSILAYNDSNAEVKGINDLQAEYSQKYGEGDYVPPVGVSYWSFRIMVGAGFLMLAILIFALYLNFEGQVERNRRFLKFLLPAMALPYLANASGWILAEVGRQPWIVFGLQKTADAVSPNISTATVWFSLITFTLIYGALAAVDVYLLRKYATQDAGDEIIPMPKENMPPVQQGAFSGD